jgi:hypothetical protein
MNEIEESNFIRNFKLSKELRKELSERESEAQRLQDEVDKQMSMNNKLTRSQTIVKEPGKET